MLLNIEDPVGREFMYGIFRKRLGLIAGREGKDSEGFSKQCGALNTAMRSNVQSPLCTTACVCMRMYVCACVYRHMYVYVCAYVYAYQYVYVYAHGYAYVFVNE